MKPSLRFITTLCCCSTLLTTMSCHRNTLTDPGAPPPGATLYRSPPLPMEKVWVPELAGTTPPDTTVIFRADSGRTVIMRHGPPDNAIFALIHFGPGALAPQSGDMAQVIIHPVPGRVGLEILTPDAFTEGAEATISYAIHFQAPSDALVKFGSAGRFEQALAAARVLADGRLQFLKTDRPAADMVRFGISAPATYLLATPR